METFRTLEQYVMSFTLTMLALISFKMEQQKVQKMKIKHFNICCL
jgi:hypothetical protein